MRFFGTSLLLGVSLLGIGGTPRQAPPLLPGPIHLPDKAKAPTPGPAKTSPPAKPSQAAPPSSATPNPVSVDPNPCLPGQTVTFYLPSEVSRATVTGGGFGKGTTIDAGDAITDTPRKTTTYTFDLTSESGGKSGGKAAQKPVVSHQAKVTVAVYDGEFPRLATYHDPHHWRIDCLAGWNRNAVPLPDPAENTLIYFQPQEDSPERTTVAIVPVKAGTSSADLMQKAMADTASQYNLLHELNRKETTQCGVPAIWVTLDGFDQDHPDVPVKAMAVGFVRDGKGYVISGRTRKSDFDQKAKLMGCLIRSFAFEPPAQPSGESRPAAARPGDSAGDAHPGAKAKPAHVPAHN